MISRLLEVVISLHSGRPDLTVARRVRRRAWAGLRPPPRSGRALPLAVALRDRRWLTLHRQHSTSPFAHTRAHDIRSAREPTSTHAYSLTRRALFLRVTLSLSAGMHGWMHTRHTATQRGGDRSPAALSSPTLFCCLFFRTFKFLPKVASRSPSSFGDSVRASPRHDEPTSASGAIEALALEWMRHLINVVTPALLRLPSAWRSNLGNFLHRVASPASPVCVTRCVQLAQTRNS